MIVNVIIQLQKLNNQVIHLSLLMIRAGYLKEPKMEMVNIHKNISIKLLLTVITLEKLKHFMIDK
jgi:hypothetical protein